MKRIQRNGNIEVGPGNSRALVLMVAIVILLPAGCAETGALRERAQEIGAAVMAKIRKMRGLEPAPTPPSPPTQAPQPDIEKPAPEPETPTVEAARPPSPAAPRVLAPMPIRALNVRGTCQARDETGYAERIDLEVVDGRVTKLAATVDVPRRGGCRFDLAEFRQGLRLPHVELAALADASCVVRMWQQDARVVVAATGCAQKCTRQTFDYIWPFELDSGTGTCIK